MNETPAELDARNEFSNNGKLLCSSNSFVARLEANINQINTLSSSSELDYNELAPTLHYNQALKVPSS